MNIHREVCGAVMGGGVSLETEQVCNILVHEVGRILFIVKFFIILLLLLLLLLLPLLLVVVILLNFDLLALLEYVRNCEPWKCKLYISRNECFKRICNIFFLFIVVIYFFSF